MTPAETLRAQASEIRAKADAAAIALTRYAICGPFCATRTSRSMLTACTCGAVEHDRRQQDVVHTFAACWTPPTALQQAAVYEALAEWLELWDAEPKSVYANENDREFMAAVAAALRTP